MREYMEKSPDYQRIDCAFKNTGNEYITVELHTAERRNLKLLPPTPDI